MKRSWWDKTIGLFSPEAEIRRIKAKGKREIMLRAYDAAQTLNSDNWKSSRSQSANLEIAKAQVTLRDRGRDAGRNNPFAIKALSAIVGNTVGTGIVPEIKSPSARQAKLAKLAWKAWAETTLCDANNLLNFYEMQALILRNVAESGEIIVKKEINPEAIQLRILESDFINSTIDNFTLLGGGRKQTRTQGIELNDLGRVTGYHLYTQHPNDYLAKAESTLVDAKDIAHVFRRERPGQLRGVSWFASVMRILEDLKTYNDLTLIRKKGEAAIAAFIIPSEGDSALSDDALREKRAQEMTLEPGMAVFLDGAKDVKWNNPPAVDGYTDYCRQMLRSVGAGLGVPYEALTGDYSQVNYSSGRMGHLEFRKNVDVWRWQMLVPQFCDKAFGYFLQWAQIVYGVDPSLIEVKWVAPAWSMIDPNKEYEAFKIAVRSGFVSAPQAIQEMGNDPDQNLEEIQEWNEKLDERGIILETDPRQDIGAAKAAEQTNNGDPNGDQNSKKDAPQGDAAGTD